MSHSYKHASPSSSSTSLIQDPRVHMAGAILLLAVTLWLSVLMTKDYSAADMAASKYPKVIMFVHRPAGKALVCALWLIVGMLVCKCICHHMQQTD